MIDWKPGGKVSLAAALGLGAAASYQLLYADSYLRQWWAAYSRPWVNVGAVKEINVFPIKSGAPLQVHSATCTVYGLQSEGGARDRHMSIIDTNNNNRFVNMRGSGRVILLRMEHRRDAQRGVVVTLAILDESDDMPEPIEVELERVFNDGKVHNVSIWTDEHVLSAYDCGDAAADWIRTVLKVDPKETAGWRLVCHKPGMFNKRDINKLPGIVDVYPVIKPYNDKPMFANGMPYMVTSSASLDDLDRRLRDANDPVNELSKRIRSNIVIGTDGHIAPYEEEKWCEIKVANGNGNDVTLACVGYCGRCPNTTVDPDTGERHPRAEPLNHMQRYRPKDPYKKHHPPQFGVNCALCGASGVIRTGDTVYARYGKITK